MGRNSDSGQPEWGTLQAKFHGSHGDEIRTADWDSISPWDRGTAPLGPGALIYIVAGRLTWTCSGHCDDRCANPQNYLPVSPGGTLQNIKKRDFSQVYPILLKNNCKF